MTLYRDQLDRARCEDPHCDHKDDEQDLFLSPKCHEGAPVEVYYHRADGCAHVQCAICQKQVASIKVARADA